MKRDRKWDAVLVTIFCVVALSTLAIIFGYARAAEPLPPTWHGDGIDRATHDSMMRMYEDALDRMQSNRNSERVEFGIVVSALAATCAALYLNSRKDARSNRQVTARLAEALERLPCRPVGIADAEQEATPRGRRFPEPPPECVGGGERVAEKG